jgi:hypothetical protein
MVKIGNQEVSNPFQVLYRLGSGRKSWKTLTMQKIDPGCFPDNRNYQVVVLMELYKTTPKSKNNQS